MSDDGPALDDLPDPDSARKAMSIFLACVGVYASILAGIRVAEIALASPAGWLQLLAALMALYAVLGLLSIAYGVWNFVKVGTAPAVGWVLSAAVLVVVVAHALTTFSFDDAVAQGGVLWGVVYTLTLTRFDDPAGATQLGLSGYRIGQLIGFALAAIWPAIIVVLSRLAMFQKRELMAEAARAITPPASPPEFE